MFKGKIIGTVDFTKDGTVNMMLDDMLTDIYNLKTDNDKKRVASFKIKANNKVIFLLWKKIMKIIK